MRDFRRPQRPCQARGVAWGESPTPALMPVNGALRQKWSIRSPKEQLEALLQSLISHPETLQSGPARQLEAAASRSILEATSWASDHSGGRPSSTAAEVKCCKGSESPTRNVEQVEPARWGGSTRVYG